MAYANHRVHQPRSSPTTVYTNHRLPMFTPHHVLHQPPFTPNHTLHEATVCANHRSTPNHGQPHPGFAQKHGLHQTAVYTNHRVHQPRSTLATVYTRSRSCDCSLFVKSLSVLVNRASAAAAAGCRRLVLFCCCCCCLLPAACCLLPAACCLLLGWLCVALLWVCILGTVGTLLHDMLATPGLGFAAKKGLSAASSPSFRHPPGPQVEKCAMRPIPEPYILRVPREYKPEPKLAWRGHPPPAPYLYCK